jgi:gliding motility-associated lipoprotein GldB
MRVFLTIIIVFITFLSCENKDIKTPDISKTKINFSLNRFDVDFYNDSSKTLPDLKEQYSFLFPKTISDSIWVSKMNNIDEQELFSETQKIYKDFSSTEKELTSLFKHIKYYNPRFKSPDIITMLTNIDYENRITYVDSLLLISLDAYLGENHQFYADYPKYIKENNTKKHIIVDVANAVISKQIPQTIDRTFLAKILHEGKKLYLLDIYLPRILDEEKLGYSKQKLDWAIYNEEKIWMYFIQNKLLYSTDSNLSRRFLDNAPFSKFYLEQDKLSPGKIGSWIGWKIVASYMKYNDVSLQHLKKIEPEDLLNKSKYKPKNNGN